MMARTINTARTLHMSHKSSIDKSPKYMHVYTHKNSRKVPKQLTSNSAIPLRIFAGQTDKNSCCS